MSRPLENSPTPRFSAGMRSANRRPLTAAAAGLVIGLFCASVVFADVAPSFGKVGTLLDDSFVSGPAPAVTGVPIAPGRWSGDDSEVVSEPRGVKPESGQKMLRLLRADCEGKANPNEGHVADFYRWIDVRPCRHEFADGSVLVQLSAALNAGEFRDGEIYSSRMTCHAVDAETVTNGALRIVSARDEHGLATASTGPARRDRDSSTWQRRSSDSRVPFNTDFRLIHLIISPGRGNYLEAGFFGDYVDDVGLTMRHNPLS